MPTIYCRHIRTNGRRCCSPALQTSAFCYYHGRSIQRHASISPAPDATPTIIHPLNTDAERQRNPIIAEYYAGVPTNPGPLSLDFPALEDRESIQVAISMLLSALGQNRLDSKRAGAMLYGLQVASSNAQKLNNEPGFNKVVRSALVDPTGQELAPDEDPQEIIEFNQFLEAYEDEEGEDEEDNEAEEED
jgi:hypothetical protein